MPCREWGGDALQNFLSPSALGVASPPKLSHAKELIPPVTQAGTVSPQTYSSLLHVVADSPLLGVPIFQEGGGDSIVFQ